MDIDSLQRNLLLPADNGLLISIHLLGSFQMNPYRQTIIAIHSCRDIMQMMDEMMRW